ncbi:MAG: ABC transporter ATP-binding protein [Candidatus Bathyarchaeia archaeon]|jgi:branched-chain amino acid transport system ATP-binding protein
MLKVEELHAGYTGSEVLHSVNLEAADGEITILIGPNGAGKTTLLKTIIGLVRPTAGRVYAKNKEITHASPAEIIKLGISYSPQGATLFPSMTVKENLEMGYYTLSDKRALKKRLIEIGEIFPILKTRMHQKAGLLSGGERQMLAIGRALISSPKLILLDEPSAGLDVGKQAVIFEKLVELNKIGIAILLVEQNVEKAVKIAHRAYLMSSGDMKFSGEPAQLAETVLSGVFGQ